ncbi:MAG: branched-chain amino acid ABC transporter permease [Burkholderiales bacterium]
MTQILASGLAMGCIYALVGLSFILIYNATHGLNFAHGELVMLGAFVFYSMVGTSAPYWVAALGALIAMGAFGYVFQRLLFYPLRDRPFLAFVIATIGFSIFARNLALLVWGPNPLKVKSYFEGQVVNLFDVVLTPEHVFIVVVTAIVLALQYALFFHTDLGRRLRATAQNPEVAQLMGIRPHQMIAITFVVATLLTAVAGVLVAPIFLLDTELGLNLILKAFIAVIIGGFGSVPGAVVGGIVVGLLEILIAVYISSVYKDAIAFAVLIFFLIAFPQGIFGERIAERA